jgi:hypothetical protein
MVSVCLFIRAVPEKFSTQTFVLFFFFDGFCFLWQLLPNWGRGASTGGGGQQGGPARTGEGMDGEGPSKGKLEGCIMHQVHTNKGERRTTFAKAYVTKVRCYWELFGKHVRNLGSLCSNCPPPPRPPTKKQEKKSLHGKSTVRCPIRTLNSGLSTLLTNHTLKRKTLPPTHKEKNEDPALHVATSHWLHGNSIPKIGCHYFWPGLIALLKNTLPIIPQHYMFPFSSSLETKKKLDSIRMCGVFVLLMVGG